MAKKFVSEKYSKEDLAKAVDILIHVHNPNRTSISDYELISYFGNYKKYLSCNECVAKNIIE